MKLINSRPFETVIGILIILNLALTWYETDLLAQRDRIEEPPKWLSAMNLLMLILYASEVMIRLVAMQTQFFQGIVNWETFDLLLVLSDVFFLVLKAIWPELNGNAGMRALRVGRSLRMVKAIRIWSPLRELYIMMHGLLGAFKAMMWSFVMLLLVLILFGIFAVDSINPIVRRIDADGGFPDCGRCHRAFASVWDSMITFFQQTVAGDSWGLITIPVMESEPWTQPFFIAVIVTIQFGILNLILVAIVDQAHQSSQDDADFQARTRHEEYLHARQGLLHLCATIDTDKSGEISIDELMSAYETMPELANQLRFLDVKQEDMVVLLAVLDKDKSGDVLYEEFVDQLFNMQNLDTGVMLYFIRSYIEDVRTQVRQQGEDMQKMCEMCLSQTGNARYLPSAGDCRELQLTHVDHHEPSSLISAMSDTINALDAVPPLIQEGLRQTVSTVFQDHARQIHDDIFAEYQRTLVKLMESVRRCEDVASTAAAHASGSSNVKWDQPLLQPSSKGQQCGNPLKEASCDSEGRRPELDRVRPQGPDRNPAVKEALDESRAAFEMSCRSEVSRV